jgi:hypothetical protein
MPIDVISRVRQGYKLRKSFDSPREPVKRLFYEKRYKPSVHLSTIVEDEKISNRIYNQCTDCLQWYPMIDTMLLDRINKETKKYKIQKYCIVCGLINEFKPC